MKWTLPLIIIVVLTTLTSAAVINSTNYATNLVIASGDFVNSTNYKAVQTIGKPESEVVNSTSYKELSGYSLSAGDAIAPEVTLTSPENLFIFRTGGSLNYVFSLVETSPSNCSLVFSGSIVDTQNTSSSGSYTFSYDSKQDDGSKAWYVSCTDESGNVGNSSIRIVNFQTNAASGGGGGADYLGLRFENLNAFGTSYIHRSDHNPMPDQPVSFTVYLNNPSDKDKVLFYYSTDNKQTFTPVLMSYDEEVGSFNTLVEAYPAQTILHYYVEASRYGDQIRTPTNSYEVLVWDNPPSSEVVTQNEFKRFIETFYQRILIIAGIIVAGLIIFFLIKKGKQEEKREIEPEKKPVMSNKLYL